MSFTDEQKKHLNAMLDPKHVAKRSQSGFELSYIEGWHAIAEANRIFGFDGWTRETVELIENVKPTQNKNGKDVVSFRAKVRVTAGGITREGIGFGSGIANNIHDAYEGAIKEAETDAMKRALMTFGNPFGLALYDKKQENVGVEPFSGDEFLALQQEIESCKTHADLNKARDKAIAAKPRMNNNQKKAVAEFIKKQMDIVCPPNNSLTQQAADLINAPIEGLPQ